VQCGNLVKIGMAKDVRNRFMAIQHGVPFHVRLIGFVEPSEGQTLRALELSYHQRFDSLWHWGEWFRLEGELQAFCNALTRGPQ
jgi:hypothetical protein